MLFFVSVHGAPWVRSAVVSAALACVCVAHAADDKSADSLAAVVVTATRSPQPLAESLADVTLITRDEIARQGYGDLATLLSYQAGIEISRNGGPASTASVFVRGAESRYVIVLIDGVRVETQTTQGGAPWQDLPLSNIDRIELVRGASGAAYGSNAVAGVVQIFTRRGQGGPALVELGAGVGSRGLVKGDAQLSGEHGPLDYAFSLAREIAKGSSATTRADLFGGSVYNPDRDGYASQNMSAKVGLQVTADHRLAWGSTDGSNRVDFDNGASPTAVTRSKLRTMNMSWTAQWTPALLGTYQVAESVHALDIPDFFSSNNTRVRSYLVQHDLKQGMHEWQALLERKEDTLKDVGQIDATPQRALNGVALAYGGRSQKLSWQMRVRHDNDSEFGHQNTGSLAGGFALTPAVRLHASVSNAFRTPTLFERFCSYCGNPDLRMEKSKQAELGMSWTAGAANATATLFHNKISNRIDYVGAGYVNVGKATMQGLSLAGSVPFNGVRLRGSVDWQRPVNDATGELLVRRARVHGSLGVETDVAAWQIGAQLKASSYRMDGSQRLGGYAVVDMFAQRQLSKQWQLLLKVDNLTDKSYETAYGYGQAGVAGLLAVRFTPEL